MSASLSRSGARALVLVGLLMLVVSVGLLLYASTHPGALPRWGGMVDVALAFLLVGWLAALHVKYRPAISPMVLLASNQVFAFLFPLVFVGLWFSADRLTWNILLPGLAWRSFVVVQGLPVAMAAWSEERRER
ncbi:MAG: hypothetical protein ABI647_18125 [Gemmatimonadota bacterium]